MNLILLLKKRLGTIDGKTAYDVVFQILDYIEENQNLSISFQDAMEFLDRNPFFNSFRMLFLNPNGMVPEVFFQIALRRLERGEIGLLIAEAPRRGETAKGFANHLAVVHSEDGDVFLDGLKIDLDTLINMVYFSSINSLLFFHQKCGDQMMGQEYLTDYEKRSLNDSAEVIQKNYPLVSLNQIRDDIEAMKPLDTPWERARFRNFLRKIKSLVYRL